MDAPFFREIPHPADLCLAVWGETRGDLYAHAGMALFHSLDFGPDENVEPVRHALSLAAPDPETLLVDWLSELLYTSEQGRVHWQTFAVEMTTSTSLRGEVGGLRPSRPRREVKAVTFAGLNITQDEAGRWTAVITFDV